MLQRARSAYRNWWLDAIIIIPLFPNFLSLSLSLSVCLFLSLFIFLIFLSFSLRRRRLCIQPDDCRNHKFFVLLPCKSLLVVLFLVFCMEGSRNGRLDSVYTGHPIMSQSTWALYTVLRRRTACFSCWRQCILNKDMNDGGRKSSKIREQKEKFGNRVGWDHSTEPFRLSQRLLNIFRRDKWRKRERERKTHQFYSFIRI